MNTYDPSLQSANAYAAERIGNDGPASPLGDATRRIQVAANSLRGLAGNMNAHADRVFGSVPETSGERATLRGVGYGGALGELLTAIVDLEEVQAELAHACGRNSTLA